jgi:predicted PurR-regulated permease PerM
MNPSAGWPRHLQIAAVLVIILATGFLLKVAEAVLVPFALAVLLAFLLHPLVKRVQRAGIPRTAAVVLVVGAAAIVIGLIGFVVSAQVKMFADELPRHRRNIEEKVTALKTITRGGTLDRLAKMMESIDSRTDRQAEDEVADEVPAEELSREAGDPAKSADVEKPLGFSSRPAVATASPDSLFGVPMLSTILGSIGTAGIVAVLVIFFLVYHADIRDRIVAVAGRGALATTTKALEEAGARISRYLLVQFAVNASYGLAVAVGLALLDVPYAAMWGLLAGCLRYLPYVGPWVAALLPIGVSLATSSGWTQPLLVIGLFVVLELVSNNVMEPVLYGHSVGVSSVAVILSAVIWAWLWGAVGLVLATPMTVCLVVLGKYVPGLRIFDQLLGERPPVSEPIRLYQRLLARDAEEAEDVVEEYQRINPLVATCDKLLLPALDLVHNDLARGQIDDDDAQWIYDELHDYIDELPQWAAGEAPPDEAPRHEATAADDLDGAAPVILGMSARSDAEDVALHMLARIMSEVPCRFETLSSRLLFSERLERVAESAPTAVCVSALPPGDMAHVRRICKKLRQRFPDLKLLVGRWSAGREADREEQLIAAGADQVIHSLAEMQRVLKSAAQIRLASNGNGAASSRGPELATSVVK